MHHCPHCHSEYQDWVKACLACASPLEDGPAAPLAEESVEELEELVIEPESPEKVAAEDISNLVIEPEELRAADSEVDIEESPEKLPYPDSVSIDMIL